MVQSNIGYTNNRSDNESQQSSSSGISSSSTTASSSDDRDNIKGHQTDKLMTTMMSSSLSGICLLICLWPVVWLPLLSS